MELEGTDNFTLEQDIEGWVMEKCDGWRDHYDLQTPIDPTGKLPGGETFQTLPEFRSLLVAREEQFTRCLTEKLLTYALGRELEISDRPIIGAMFADLKSKSGGLQDLIHLVALSKSLQSN